MISGRNIDEVSICAFSLSRRFETTKKDEIDMGPLALADVSSSESGSLQLNDDVIVKGGGLGWVYMAAN